MTEDLSLRSRLAALSHKYGYAREVKNRLEAKGLVVTERHIYFVVHGYQRKFSLEIELEVEQYLVEKEKYEADLKARRKALQVA